LVFSLKGRDRGFFVLEFVEILSTILFIELYAFNVYPLSDIILLLFNSQASEKMEPVKVVVRYANGRILKGYTEDFLPTNPSFRVRPFNPETSEDSVEILIKDLKAVFFVREFLGDPNYMERKEFLEGAKIIGKGLEVTFKDGEFIVGSSLSYDPERPGFFLSPADPKGNNLGIFVVSQAVRKVRNL
jgi:hypothetical protein